MSLSIGDALPGFKLKDQEGQEFSSADHIGAKPLVVFFYPKDFTPGCTREVCDFRDKYEDFTRLGARVIGISSDSTGSHAKFAARYRLPFTLLSDPKGQVRKLFGIKNSFLNLLPGRETFIFDQQGLLAHRYRNSMASDHMKQALAAVQKLQNMEYYPLLFKPQIKERIWGGEKLNALFGKPAIDGPAGESWELSGVSGTISEVQNGPLAGTLLTDLIEQDPEGILGTRVVENYGTEFPILIKFIDAKTDLSIQVHPDDSLAAKRHGSKGKTEMWYIMDADPGARLVLGFKEKIDRSHYSHHLKNKTLFEVLHEQPVQPGEVYYIKAGTVHAIGGGIVLAEIQQTSDITYRVYDYDRVGTDGKPRELHTDLALDVMDLKPAKEALISYDRVANQANAVVNCPYFITNYLPVSGRADRDLSDRTAFTIYMCVEGAVSLQTGNDAVSLAKGMTAFIPAILKQVMLEGEGELLEITL